jgi:hypothetical protein
MSRPASHVAQMSLDKAVGGAPISGPRTRRQHALLFAAQGRDRLGGFDESSCGGVD